MAEQPIYYICGIFEMPGVIVLPMEALEKGLITRDRGAEIFGIRAEDIMDRIEDRKNDDQKRK